MTINYAVCIHYLYPDIKTHEYALQNDGEGVYIAAWHYSKPQPTVAQMESISEKAMRQDTLQRIREERKRRLISCDWTQLPDSKVQEVWKDYREALRDFPATCDPDNPVWPIEPKITKTKQYSAAEVARIQERNDTAKKDLGIMAAYHAYKTHNSNSSLSDYLDTLEAFAQES